MTERIGYIYIRDNGTPEELAAWSASMDDDASLEDSDEEEELQWLRDHWDEMEREMMEGDADIAAHRASRIQAWSGSTSHPNRISRMFVLPSGGALMLSKEVGEGSSLEATASQADEAFRQEGWAIPEVDRYVVVPGADPEGWFGKADADEPS